MHPAYRCAQPFTTLWTLMPVTSLVLAAVLWLGGGPQAQLGIGVVLSTTVVTLAVMGRLVVEVHADRVHWRFGWLGVPRWSLPLDQVVACEPARGSAGGAGIKGSRRDREYTAALASPAVRLRLQDGRSVLIGSPEPDRLRSFIEARLPAGASRRG